jgi:hypothetical protein
MTTPGMSILPRLFSRLVVTNAGHRTVEQPAADSAPKRPPISTGLQPLHTSSQLILLGARRYHPMPARGMVYVASIYFNPSIELPNLV